MTALTDLPAAARAALAQAEPATVAIGRHGRGAGVVVAPGRVVTNAHNLRDRTTSVTFADGRVEQGQVAGTDADHDLVVLEVDTGDAPALSWSSSTVEIGDVVFAVGRGRGGSRVTFGLVSGTARAFRGPRGRRVRGAVEHTAPLARGSSGGPLLDAEGKLVGLNTHRLGEGFYLALPADAELRERLDALAEGRDIAGKRLGIALVPGHVAERLRRKVGLPERAGLLVAAVVPGSPAEQAGIDEGDLIVAIGGTPITTVDELWDVLDGVGDEVTLSVVRGTDEREIPLTFA
ncbi:MAG: serine protease [Acidimicrobiales bacterium]|nr:serine protease [Acidimicrobiales bacterium]